MKKFWAGMLPALAEWAKTEQGREILLAGAYANVHNDLEWVEATIVEAEAKLNTLRERAIELEAKRRQLARDG